MSDSGYNNGHKKSLGILGSQSLPQKSAASKKKGYSQSDPSTSEDFDLIFSVEDEDIFPDVKKAAAFEAADVAVGLTEGVFSVWFAPEESGTELPEFWGCWLLLFSVKPEPDTVAELAVVFPVGWSGSGWLAITVEASVAVVVWVTDEVEFVPSSWIGLKEAPTEIRRKNILQR